VATVEDAAMSEPLVFKNDRFVPASQANLAIYDAGIVLGATVTDMTRTFRHQLFRPADHVDRFFRSLKYMRFDLGLSKTEVLAIGEQLIAHNSRFLGAGDELGLIHFATPGEYRTYAGSAGGTATSRPTLVMHTFPLPWEIWANKVARGAHVVTPSIRHVPPQCIDPKVNYRSRMHYYLADKEATLADPNAIALLLDLDGNVTETSGANILIVEKGCLVSPTLRNTLPGVSRQTVIELAAELGIPFVERDIQVFNVMTADEAFLTTTPSCLLPVTKINGTMIADGRPGPIFQTLHDAWSDLVGLDIHQQLLDGANRRRLLTS